MEHISLGNSIMPQFTRRYFLPCLLIGLAAQLTSAQDVIIIGPALPAPAATAAPSPDNLHVVATEDVLNRLVARCETELGEIQDRFEDTPIAGRQVTASRLTVDLRPSSSTGRMLVVLEGETSSATSGFSPQAVINSVGRQQFRATKEILFDGYELATWHAAVSAHAESQNVGAVTMFSGRPIGPLVEQVILGIAQKRQPAAEAFARQRVVERVYPHFDSEIDAQLAGGNRLLKDTVQPRLKTLKLIPERLRVRSTDTHLHLAASVAIPLDVSEIAPAPDRLVHPHELSIYLHESLLQGLVERAELAGLTMTRRELIQLLKRFGMAEDSLPSGLADLNVDIVFADADPVRIRILDDETRVTIRVAFKTEGQSVVLQFEITVPFRLVLMDEKWRLRGGPVQVRSLEAGSDGTSIAELAVKQVIEAILPSPEFPKQLPASLWPTGKTPPKLSSIRSAAGWLVLGVD